jgi:hypothetical protein
MAKKKQVIEINEEEFPSNSNVKRVVPIRPEKEVDTEEQNDVVEEPKKARRTGRVISATRKKKSLVQSIAETIAGEDTQNVTSYILYEVLIPAAKNTIQEMITSGIEMFLYGEKRDAGRSRGRDRDRTIVSYGSYYKSRDRDEDRRDRRRMGSHNDRFGLNDIYFDNHSDAEEVLDELCNRLEKYDAVTVADYFDLANIEGATWAHEKYGWESLKKAYNTHTRHGWAIVLPEPIELE